MVKPNLNLCSKCNNLTFENYGGISFVICFVDELDGDEWDIAKVITKNENGKKSREITYNWLFTIPPNECPYALEHAVSTNEDRKNKDEFVKRLNENMFLN